MNKKYLENLTNEQLRILVINNNGLRNMLEEKYIEDTMYYVEDILEVVGGKKWDIGFYQYNYWYSARTRKSMEAIIEATDSFGLCSEEEVEKVKYCIELMNRLDYMSYDNKQYDNLETKIENLLNEIDDIVTINFNKLTDDSYIDNDLLLEELYCTLDCEDETYYILDDDLDVVYKDDVKEFC